MTHPGHPIRVLVADDHLVVRLGIVTLVKTQPDMEVVAQAASGREVVELFREHRPDVVLMDLGLSGDETIAAVCAEETHRQRDPEAGGQGPRPCRAAGPRARHHRARRLSVTARRGRRRRSQPFRSSVSMAS